MEFDASEFSVIFSMLGDSWNACNKKVILKVFMLKPSINLTHLIMTHHMTSANESRNDSSWVIIMPDQSNKWNVFLTYCKNIFRWSNQNLALVYLTTDWLTKSRTWLALSQLEDAFIRNTSALKFIFFFLGFSGDNEPTWNQTGRYRTSPRIFGSVRITIFW